MKFQIIPPFKAAEAANIITNPSKTLGIEVTIPSVDALCGMGNVDHHREGDDENTPSACEQVLNGDYSDKPDLVVGIMADADTLVSMALIKIGHRIDEDLTAEQEAEGENVLWSNFPRSDYRWAKGWGHSGRDAVLVDVVKDVGLVDRFGPSKCSELMQGSEVKAIRAIAASRTPTEQQVSLVAEILTSSVSDGNAEIIDGLVKASDRALKAARDSAEIQMLAGGVVLVKSTDFAATQIGYEHGDVVIALNSEMLKDRDNPSAGTYKKFTLCKRDSHVPATINWDKLNELEGAEGTWGGRPTIGGSPQGEDSTLTIEQVVSCIELQ